MMATQKEYLAYLEDCLGHLPEIRLKAMFGGHTVYCGEAVVGLICNQTLFIKMTPGTSALLDGRAETGPPYEGAKPAWVLTEAEFEDKAFIASVVMACREDVAAGKTPKKPAKKASRRVSPKGSAPGSARTPH